MKHESTSSTGMLLGMAAGAALGAVGVKGAENAVLQLDRMVGDFVEKHME